MLVYSDATPTQLGVICQDKTVAQPIAPVHIFLSEAAALNLALDLSSSLSVVTFVVDNKPLYYAVRKGWSPDRAVNRIISRILSRRLAGDRLFIKWVPSKENPADLPSRTKLNEPYKGLVVESPSNHLIYENFLI